MICAQLCIYLSVNRAYRHGCGRQSLRIIIGLTSNIKRRTNTLTPTQQPTTILLWLTCKIHLNCIAFIQKVTQTHKI